MAGNIELRRKDPKGKELISEPVFNIFNDYLRPDNPISAAQAAIAISKLAPEPANNEKTLGDGFLFKLWRDVVAVAEQIPLDNTAQDKLVGVLRELTLLPDTGLTVWDFRLWIDLPVLGAAFREYLNGPGKSAIEEEQLRIDQAWVRFHAFSAKLMNAGVIYFENQPIWILRDALEEERNPPKSSELDRDLTAAAMYIEFYGPVLVEALAANPEPELNDERRRLLRGGSLFHGGSGLRLERWLFWARRFREEAEKTRTEEARSISLRAARLIEIWSEKRLKK